MNDLYLIGNGFDLAHGLETSYNHFLLLYLKNAIKECNWKKSFDDKLITVSRNNYVWNNIEDCTSIKGIFEEMKRMEFSIKSKHDFFEKIIKSFRNFKWVDIEYEYYIALVEIYKVLENKNLIRSDYHFNQVASLNNCFDAIRVKLIEYLQSIKIAHEKHIQIIEDALIGGNGLRNNEKGDKLYVYFNYTNTMDLYSHKFLPKNSLVYIHGKLSDINNPVIFGYGDEIHPYYEKMENLNSNDFLKNIKSFGYFKTNNYQRIMRFIEGSFNPYTVKILGHSCGLSDRILLNTIFEHPNCKAIKIYYHQKSETENDYFEKTQEISRHFKSTSKGEMRNKIVSFEMSSPLLPYTK